MQNTPLIIPWLISAILTFSMGVYTIRHRKHVASIPLALMCFFAAIWAGSYIFEMAGITLTTKIWGQRFSYIGVVGTPLSWAAFAIAYSGHTRWLTRRNILLALIFPILSLIVFFTNNLHHWFFTSITLFIHPISKLISIDVPKGWWFWLHTIYAYVFLLLGTYLLIKEYWDKRKIYRSQVIINISAILFPWISNGLIIFGVLSSPVDITSVTFAISILILGWGILRYRLLEIVPIAHRVIFESMSDAVVVLDQDLRIVDINSAALTLFQLKETDMMGKSFGSAFKSKLDIDEKFIKERDYRQEISFQAENGTKRWADLSISALHDAYSQGQIVILRDITRLKEKEEALALARDEALQANNFKTQLLANVSHELRTPLGVIMGYVDLMARKSYGEISEKQALVLGRIRDSTEYLDGLVSELLDQAQLDNGRLKLIHIPFELRETLEKASNQLSLLAESKKIDFTVLISDDMPTTIFGDSQRLKQIFINLVGNAIKFTKTGGVTANIFKASPTQWKMQVTDTGPGIPQDALNTIFEPFKQLPEASKMTRKGYGLGLSITKQLINLMGGNIEIKSQVGVGTTFTAVLPLIAESEHIT